MLGERQGEKLYSIIAGSAVLHSFQKKSKHGIATPQQDIDLVKKRLKDAQKDYSTETAS